jgi:hypothetical protein
MIGLITPMLHPAMGPSPANSGTCVGDAKMATAIANGLLGRIQRATSPNDAQACVDSGCTTDMCPLRESFVTYTPLDNCYVTLANSEKTKCAGRGTVSLQLQDRTVQLNNVLHVPDLEMTLLSVRSHRRRGQGCSFLADESGCFLTFPDFVLEIDDTNDCVLPCKAGTSRASHDYRESSHRHKGTGRFTRQDTFRLSAKRARGTMLMFAEGHARRVNIPPQAEVDPSEILKYPAPAPKLNLDTTPALERRVAPPVRPCEVPESSAAATIRYTPQQLHKLLGCRNLPDYKVLQSLGTGVHVADIGEPLLSVGSVVNVQRGRKGRSLSRPKKALDTVGMDVCYGDGVSPGGYSYCLMLVDRATRKTWVYGLKDMNGSTIADALWRFFIDAGGFPKKIQCDFDPKFMGGKVRRLLNSHAIRLTAAPPNRQSQNGLVESHWKMACAMARSLLAEAQMPKVFWFWAVREAVQRMNLIPVEAPTPEVDATGAQLKVLTTPHELFYGVKPDLRILFPFGSIGYYHRPSDGGRGKRKKFESKAFTGIALGRSDNANGMMFWNPTLSRFCVSADYKLDSERTLEAAFPDIRYDGGLYVRLYSNPTESNVEAFPVGAEAFAKIGEEPNGDALMAQGHIISVPTPINAFYQVRIVESQEVITCERSDLMDPDEPLGGDSFHLPSGLDADDGSDPFSPTLPEWMRVGGKVTLLVNEKLYKGKLDLDTDNDWVFTVRGRDGQVVLEHGMFDLPYSWRQRIIEGSLVIGHQLETSDDVPRHETDAIARHVSAAALQEANPGILRKALSHACKDREVWLASYLEEHSGLVSMDTMEVLTTSQYRNLKNAPKAIPTMCVLTVKTDENNKPVRAKSRIVVLGNLEEREWTRPECYAPVLRQDSLRLLASLAVQKRRVLKQGDCKNAFCQPTLPDDELVVVTPPPGCPISAPGTYWKLKKTLYGLRRSPRHWFNSFRGHLLSMGFKQCAHDPCIFIGAHPDFPTIPIYVGCYVDDFVYYSTSDDVEKWFETGLAERVKVDFMGTVSWFLGIFFDWKVTSSYVSVHLSQEGFVSELLERHGLTDCNPSPSPYRSGFVIDRIPEDDEPPSAEAITQYQSLIGGLTWLHISTRPDIGVAHKLLCAHLQRPSSGHMTAAKHILRYLKGSSSRGIRFTSKGHHGKLTGYYDYPIASNDKTSSYCDANWGPQDASQPNDSNKDDLVTIDECRSLSGVIIVRMGGAVAWKSNREKKVSRSSCESEIHATDECCKLTQGLRLIMHDLGLTDVESPTDVYNDNRGCVDWTKGWANRKMRHMNIREMAVREAQLNGEIHVHHIEGKLNPSDLLTKEHKTGEAFVQLCNLVVPSRSDGGCWNPESEILKSEKDGKKEPKEEPTKASTLAN